MARYYEDANEAMIDLEDNTGIKFNWETTNADKHRILLDSEEIAKLVSLLQKGESINE